MTLSFVTGNEHKFREAEKIANNYDIEIEHRDLEYVEIQADNLEDIVKPGIQQACNLINSPCFIEDAGLFIESLNGFPGPYSSYVYKTIGNEGVLNILKDVEDRRAEFRSAVGYCEPSSDPEIFIGKIRGTISKEIRGSKGFGYDPIFIPERGEGNTFAEISAEMKNYLSHRGEAIEKLVKWYIRNKKADGD